MPDLVSDIKKSLELISVYPDEKKLIQLDQYINMLNKWNKAYNLTAVRNIYEMIERHLVDSLSITDYISGNIFIDVGTGAGLPGIPLAILYPEKKFILLDSNGKKTRFLIQVKNEIKLNNISIINDRVENVSLDEKVDGVLSRAFSSLEDMLIKTNHLCKDGGLYYAMKGQVPEIELQGISKPYKVQSINWPGNQVERHLIIIEETPTKAILNNH